jgi:hypothetical protein
VCNPAVAVSVSILGEPKAWADDDADPAAGALKEEVVGILAIGSEDKAEGREGIIALHETMLSCKTSGLRP